MKEKVVTLQITLLVAQLLKKQGYEVFLTRSTDTTVSLSERITKAHEFLVDVFFSIHANAGSSTASGIETFYSDCAHLESTMSVMGKKERKTTHLLAQKISNDSKQLAQEVQKAVVATVKKLYPGVKDRGSKSGSCQVLMGFQGPAALIEVGYLTAAREGALLQDNEYQKQLALGICEGIKMFIDKHFA